MMATDNINNSKGTMANLDSHDDQFLKAFNTTPLEGWNIKDLTPENSNDKPIKERIKELKELRSSRNTSVIATGKDSPRKKKP